MFLVLGSTTATVSNTTESLTNKVDPSTPLSARTTRLLSKPGSEALVATFTDEFTVDGRSFADDSKWVAINSYNPTTSDLEAYVPSMATTSNGTLRLTVSDNITVDASGTARPYASAMLQTWNTSCLQGGVLEVSLRLPGSHNLTGLWPAVWLLGNLGRTGYGKVPPGKIAPASISGMWPWSYSTCRNASLPYYAPPNVYQQYDACPADALTVGYCQLMNLSKSVCNEIRRNKALLHGSTHGGRGRGVTEIDLLEVQVLDGQAPKLSTSLQIAPTTGANGWVSQEGECFDQMAGNLSTGAGTKVNGWHGVPGAEVISGLTELGEDAFTSQVVYRLEWLPGNRIAWYLRRAVDEAFTFLFEVRQEALAACGTVGTSYRTEARPLPEEPSYIMLNVALSNSFSPVRPLDPAFSAGFPYQLEVDYVRAYQPRTSADGTPPSARCETAEFPSAEYIAHNRDAFSHPIVPASDIGCRPDVCTASGSVHPSVEAGTVAASWHEFYDGRCPRFGHITPAGCVEAGPCRRCYPTSAFERLAFSAEGLYGSNETGVSYPIPICPPCVCERLGLAASECAEQSLPSGSGCKPLSIGGRRRWYCAAS